MNTKHLTNIVKVTFKTKCLNFFLNFMLLGKMNENIGNN